jgi:hypothetical protein
MTRHNHDRLYDVVVPVAFALAWGVFAMIAGAFGLVH